MLGTYSYNEIIRKTIIAFGTLFNEVYIKHEDGNGADYSFAKVPIAYGPIQKFLSRVEEKPDLKKRVAMTLPRMSFEMTSLKYDSSRKVSAMQTFKAIKTTDKTEQIKVFMPVPYNIGFQLSIMTKLNDDMLQIIEQILPTFQPNFTLTINLISSIGEKKDVPVVLEGIGMEDNYEGNYTERRALVYTLNFTAKTYLFGPIADSTDGLIKKVQVDYYTDTNTKNASRQLRYTATPRAIKDYDNDNTTTLAENIDDKVTVFDVSSAVSLVNDSYIMIGNEEMYIKNISGNTLTVLRGQDNTIIETHIEGDSIDVITTADNELIEMDDDFGFSESRFDFGDGKVYSTTKGIDVSL
jgi:hypothetical protein